MQVMSKWEIASFLEFKGKNFMFLIIPFAASLST